MQLNSCAILVRPARVAALFMLAIGLLLAPIARADPLDFVLDVLYKAGVIDGNVKAAKPLISCLADGKNVADCTAGAADQSEFAADPQVKNVIDIYQAFREQDYYTVLKKAGITVGCALIPGGEIKDVLCGELGKIAAAVLDGVGSVLGSVGSFVASMFGGGSDPPPMPPQDYYTLNFMPWYHWSVVYQLDNDSASNTQILNAPVAACVDYFYHHTYSKTDANKVCGDMRTWLNNAGYTIGNAFRQETDSYYQLHFAPKIDEWAVMSFNKPGTIDSLASGAMTNCLINERKKIPLPEPGFEQCEALKQSLTNLSIPFSGNSIGGTDNQLADLVYAQCMADTKIRSVPADNDAYTRICKPITNRVSGKIIIAMAELKSRMDAAAAAGCPNEGTPKSIHCDTYAAQVACEQALPEHASMCSSSNNGKAIMDAAAAAGCLSNGTPETIRCGSYGAHAACVKAIPEHASMCHLDQIAAVYGNAKSIWESVNTADAPCTFGGKFAYNKIRCVHPMQSMHCNNAVKATGDAWGPDAVEGITCELIHSPEYDQLAQQTAQALSIINADYQAPVLQAQAQVLIQTVPATPCGLARHDPLVISCEPSFRVDAIPERETAVYIALHATEANGRPRPIYCPVDDDRDGAEAPCLEGGPVPELPPAVEVAPPVPQRPTLQLRPAPVIKSDGGR